jgi:carbonic anhydrase/acetyltransferase-like protein (isoleucine patch superfamily)
MSSLLAYKNIMPEIAEGVFIAAGAYIIGDVKIGKDSAVWFNTTVRGDVHLVRIGERTNIQDCTTIHVTRETGPTHIGSGITIGHNALLHACTLEDNCFIGMGATIMDGAVVESDAMVAAGALVTPNKLVKAGELWAGNPAKFFRKLTQEEIDYIRISADNYVRLKDEYL